MDGMTPSQIVKQLDKYIIGQDMAKKSVAIALRNRYRRNQLSEDMRDEITPKNIIMMGPTGVGKTEIARRLAKLVDAPFIKIEATKFTEVGYVGRDVESMIRDLVTTSIRMVKQREMEKVQKRAEALANDMLLDLIVPIKRKESKSTPFDMFFGGQNQQQTAPEDVPAEIPEEAAKQQEQRVKRETVKESLLKGELEEMIVEVSVEDNPGTQIGVIGGMGGDEMNMDISGILGGFLPKKKKKRKMTVAQARKHLTNEEAQKLIDIDMVKEEGLRNAEQNGIIFLDEIDKIAARGNQNGPDVSREGVQRDILPIVEGCTVNTKYGPIKTDFMLFIGAGAFHMSKVSDLIPELQGRFPITVSLDSLSCEDFYKILTQPQNAIIKQYQQLLQTEGISLEFTEEALEEVAKIATHQNENQENIGARRLYTVIEKLLEEISFYASDYEQEKFEVNKEYVLTIFKEEEEAYKKDTEKYIL